jgi:hypothetical protein
LSHSISWSIWRVLSFDAFDRIISWSVVGI